MNFTTSFPCALRAVARRGFSAFALALLLGSPALPPVAAAPGKSNGQGHTHDPGSPSSPTAAGRIALGPDTTPGDATHLYRITQPGSYYLANSVVPGPGQSGIEILIGGVTLDLNGHGLTGTDSSQTGLTIVNAYGPVRVFNGFLRNWKAAGIEIANGTVDLESIVVGDSGTGIRVREASTARITRCTVEENELYGIDAVGIGASSTVTVLDSAARGNGLAGFFLMRSVVRDSTAYRNGTDGIVVYNSTVTDCIAEANAHTGIQAYSSIVSRCTIGSNRGHSGLVAGGGSTLLDNNVFGHDLTPLHTGIYAEGGSNRIEGNHTLANSIGLRVTGSDNLVARNSARSLVKNYQIATGNRVGTIATPAASGVIDGNSGGGSGASDPWSNLAY